MPGFVTLDYARVCYLRLCQGMLLKTMPGNGTLDYVGNVTVDYAGEHYY